MNMHVTLAKEISDHSLHKIFRHSCQIGEIHPRFSDALQLFSDFY
jgi:hypothetical protein